MVKLLKSNQRSSRMRNIYFISSKPEEHSYFSDFISSVDHQLFTFKYLTEDSDETKGSLSFYIIRNLNELEDVDITIIRKLYFAVSFKQFSEEDKKNFFNKTALFKFLKGIIDIDQDYNFNSPMLNTIYKQEVESNSSLPNMTKDLDTVLEQSLSDLQRIKKIHERIVPIRQESAKGLTITSKFGAGESAGGEFLDIVKSEKECLILLSSSQSYVVSSIVLTHFEYFRDKEHFSLEDIQKFLRELSSDLADRDFFDNDDRILDSFIARVDLNMLNIEGYSFGDFEIMRTSGNKLSGNDLPFNEMFFEKTYFSSRLERGEKLLVVSPGLKRNLEDELPKRTLASVVSNFDKLKARQVINELFYQLKKDATGDFLAHDATAIHIEVDQNVIVQI